MIGDTVQSTVGRPASAKVRLLSRGWPEPIDPVMAVVTIGRLALIPFVLLWLTTAPLISALALALFILADIYDGVIGRQRGTDGASRRALDSIVDRLAIDLVLLAMTIRGFLPPEMLVLILARDAYCAQQCARLRTRWVAVRADWMYKVLNLSIAAWVTLAAHLATDVRFAAIVVIFSYSLIVAIDLTRAIDTVLALPRTVRHTVISAGVLRGSRRTSAGSARRTQDSSTSVSAV